MRITREHYNQLKENFITTRHLMSEGDCEIMRQKLNNIRRELAFSACVVDWKEGKILNCADFLEMCEHEGVSVSDHVKGWVMSDIVEVGQTSYSCVGKLHKTKEKTLRAICEELTSKLA